MFVALALIIASITISAFIVLAADASVLKQGVPSIGMIVVAMYALTYGLGWMLWQFNPSSLFGYATASTLGALERMGLLLTLGLPSLAAGYAGFRLLWWPSHRDARTARSFLTHAEALRPHLQRLCELLLVLCFAGLVGMTSEGLFTRDQELHSQLMASSWSAKLLVGSALLSRLAPVALVLVPFSWAGWGRWRRFTAVFLLTIWIGLGLLSASRGQLFAVPLYLLLGAILWRQISIKSALLIALGACFLALPLGEAIRVHRSGEAGNHELRRTFEAFQIGRQLMGTSHELYLMLKPEDCAADLHKTLGTDPDLHRLIRVSSEELGNPSQRYHVVRLFDACAHRNLSHRGFEGIDRLPFGLVPSTFVPSAPSLFDGQQLVERISSELQLRPGEISHGTLSIFADAYWRFRWPGVVALPMVLGAWLGFVQNLLLWMLARQPFVGILWQLLGVSLIGSWINNTGLTMTWLLLWDLPKAALELTLLAALVQRSLPADLRARG